MSFFETISTSGRLHEKQSYETIHRQNKILEETINFFTTNRSEGIGIKKKSPCTLHDFII
ncbi:hypothetical protein LCGC14_2549900 [marine sediment metagenome]|uniref:Uncharacterized protein n=1 Tax=marine sediment metagenome TaxID=412755 RepID=A0A0F9AN19_9ZZZZ